MCPPQANAKVGDRERRTHGNAEQADTQLDPSQGLEQRSGLGPGRDEPIKGLQSQGETEDILEDDHAGEALDSQVTCLSVSACRFFKQGRGD